LATFGELIRLEDEFGSLEAAAEALPERRVELLEAAAKVRKVGAAVGRSVTSLRKAAAAFESSAAREPARASIQPLDRDALQEAIDSIEPIDMRASFEQALATYFPRLEEAQWQPDGRTAWRSRIDMERAVRILVRGGSRRDAMQEDKSGTAALTRTAVDDLYARIFDDHTAGWTPKDGVRWPPGTRRSDDGTTIAIPPRPKPK
jgi:hypothetical protein